MVVTVGAIGESYATYACVLQGVRRSCSSPRGSYPDPSVLLGMTHQATRNFIAGRGPVGGSLEYLRPHNPVLPYGIQVPQFSQDYGCMRLRAQLE